MNPRRITHSTNVLPLSSVVRMSFETEETLQQRRVDYDLEMVRKALQALRNEGFINDVRPSGV